MASYLVDVVLLVALLFTSVRVTKMHRELVRLRKDQGDFGAVLGKTTDAVDDMALMIREFSADGTQLVNALGGKIEQARRAIMEIDASAMSLAAEQERCQPSPPAGQRCEAAPQQAPHRHARKLPTTERLRKQMT
jgi:hypothetical protein